MLQSLRDRIEYYVMQWRNWDENIVIDRLGNLDFEVNP